MEPFRWRSLIEARTVLRWRIFQSCQPLRLLLLGTLIFCVSGCATSSKRVTSVESPVQEIKVTVKGEYAPERIVVKKDRPVRLLFYREDDSECTSQVVFEDFRIKKDLPAKKETAVELTPKEEGEYTFVCGMDMMKGKLVVEK